MEVHTSPCLVTWAPHYVKEAELGHSHFLGWRHGQGLVFTIGYSKGTKNVLKMKHAFWLLFSILSYNYGTTTIAKVNQLST